MITSEYCLKMAQYNERMNSQLYAICDEIDDSERKADKALFFGSIHTTLNHLLWGDIVWLSRFQNKAEAIPGMAEVLYPNFVDLSQARSEWDTRIKMWADNLDEEWLASSLTFTSKSDGTQWTKPAWLLVSHMFNHETHHRGQLTAVLSQMGYDYGVTDLPFMPGAS